MTSRASFVPQEPHVSPLLRDRPPAGTETSPSLRESFVLLERQLGYLNNLFSPEAETPHAAGSGARWSRAVWSAAAQSTLMDETSWNLPWTTNGQEFLSRADEVALVLLYDFVRDPTVQQQLPGGTAQNNLGKLSQQPRKVFLANLNESANRNNSVVDGESEATNKSPVTTRETRNAAAGLTPFTRLHQIESLRSVVPGATVVSATGLVFGPGLHGDVVWNLLNQYGTTRILCYLYQAVGYIATQLEDLALRCLEEETKLARYPKGAEVRLKPVSTSDGASIDVEREARRLQLCRGVATIAKYVTSTCSRVCGPAACLHLSETHNRIVNCILKLPAAAKKSSLVSCLHTTSGKSPSPRTNGQDLGELEIRQIDLGCFSWDSWVAGITADAQTVLASPGGLRSEVIASLNGTPSRSSGLFRDVLAEETTSPVSLLQSTAHPPGECVPGVIDEAHIENRTVSTGEEPQRVVTAAPPSRRLFLPINSGGSEAPTMILEAALSTLDANRGSMIFEQRNEHDGSSGRTSEPAGSSRNIRRNGSATRWPAASLDEEQALRRLELELFPTSQIDGDDGDDGSSDSARSTGEASLKRRSRSVVDESGGQWRERAHLKAQPSQKKLLPAATRTPTISGAIQRRHVLQLVDNRTQQPDVGKRRQGSDRHTTEDPELLHSQIYSSTQEMKFVAERYKQIIHMDRQRLQLQAEMQETQLMLLKGATSGTSKLTWSTQFSFFQELFLLVVALALFLFAVSFIFSTMAIA